MDPRDDYEDFGNQGVGLEDNEEVTLFRSLEHELESLVQRYRVPPDELQQLFEVGKHSIFFSKPLGWHYYLVVLAPIWHYVITNTV